jgi:hypothetical protein
VSEIKLTTPDLKNWLEEETDSILSPVQAQAQKYLDETQKVLQNLTDSSKSLLENSQKEIEKRNMKVYNRARALNKLATLFLDRLKKLKIPEEVSYDNLNVFSSEALKTIAVVELDIKNWFPRISPFFIMDRRKFLPVFDKTKGTINNLNDFVNKDYVKSKALEKTFQIIDELQSFESQYTTVDEAKEKLKNNRLHLEKEILDFEQKIAQIRAKTVMVQLIRLEEEQEELNNKLKHELRHLQKPFLKMQALATYGGGGGITPDELKMIGLYMENPFGAITAEESGYPVLRQILEKLSKFLEEDKLKLKSDKHRKAEQDLEEMLQKNSLANLHQKSSSVAEQKKGILASEEMGEALRSLELNKEQIAKLKAQKSHVETDEYMKETQRQEIWDRMQNFKKTIESNILSFMNKQVQIL